MCVRGGVERGEDKKKNIFKNNKREREEKELHFFVSYIAVAPSTMERSECTSVLFYLVYQIPSRVNYKRS